MSSKTNYNFLSRCLSKVFGQYRFDNINRLISIIQKQGLRYIDIINHYSMFNTTIMSKYSAYTIFLVVLSVFFINEFSEISTLAYSSLITYIFYGLVRDIFLFRMHKKSKEMINSLLIKDELLPIQEISDEDKIDLKKEIKIKDEIIKDLQNRLNKK